MAPPVAMGIGAVGSVVGGFVGAAGARQEGQAAYQAAQFNAMISEYNRQVAERNKRQAIAQADVEGSDQIRVNRRQLSSIRAAYGASGLDLTGSTLDVMEDTAMEQELDVKRIKYKGEITAIGYEDEGRQHQMKAQLSRMEGEAALRASKTKALSSIIGGVTGAASIFYKGVA